MTKSSWGARTPDTVRVNIVLPAKVEEAFRAEVFARKGMKKGNISDAMTEAVRLWIQTGGTPVTRPTAKARDADPQAAAIRRMKPLDRMALAYKLSKFTRGIG